MASKFEMFDRDLKVAISGLAPEIIRRELANFARSSVADVVSSGQAPAKYDTIVNGRAGASEDSVDLPGPIVYLFSNWKLVIDSAIEELQRRVPRKSGRYAASFIVTVNGRIVTDYSAIQGEAEVIIFNFQPYTRKMETRANGSGRRHFDATKGVLNRRFSGAFKAQVMFINVGSGVHPAVPYVLKRSAGRRKDRQAGKPISYPAIVLNGD